MLASISPVGEASRSQRWSVTVTAYLLASLAGGVLVGALAGTLGTLLRTVVGATMGRVALGVLAVAALFALAVDRGVVPVRLPSWQRQVDERWLTSYRGWVYGAGFGLQLGAGVLTRIPTAATHLALLLAAATASTTGGAAVGATYGLVRALPLLGTSRLHDPARLRSFHQRLEGWSALADRTTSGVLAAAALALIAAATTGS